MENYELSTKTSGSNIHFARTSLASSYYNLWPYPRKWSQTNSIPGCGGIHNYICVVHARGKGNDLVALRDDMR